MLFGEGPQIKNIAADLNKLFRQGSLLNQIGQTVEGDSAADQGTRDLLAARDPVIQEISVGMSGEESRQYTVSGTPPLSLANSLGIPLRSWSVDVSPYQEGTGDPSPDNVRPIHGTDKLNLFVEDSYDPSATPKAVLTLPQTVYTGTIGSDGGESRWGEVDLGTLNWVVQTNYSVNRFGAPVSGMTKATSAPYYENIMCSAYNPSNIPITSVDESGTIARYNGWIYICDAQFSDAESFKAAVSGVQLAYELETPVQFSLPTPTIPTPTGTATTWATAEDGTADGMEVTYVGKA